jgi:probable HAF family extracellular repeat protein
VEIQFCFNIQIFCNRTINNNGQIVGYSAKGRNTDQAFLWQNGKITSLGTLPGGTQSWAYEINDNKQIVGSSVLGGNTIATLWTVNS